MTLPTRVIRAAEGRKVRHPGTNKVLSPAGEPVTWGSYWERLRQAGDVVEVSAEAAPPAPKVQTQQPPANATNTAIKDGQ